MKRPDHADKLRGGYYTPSHLVDFLVEWAIQSGDDRVLEPSCGDGAFLPAVMRRLAELSRNGDGLGSLVAVEADAAEARSARSSVSHVPGVHRWEIVESDFFDFASNLNGKTPPFDVVIGNPPFIRYQNFAESSREIAFRLMRDMGMAPNRLTNSWVPFVAIGSSLLSDDGRLAMVIPAELLQVNYAAEIRQLLAAKFARVTLVVFDKLVFPDIQQETVLLLGERSGPKQHGIRVVTVPGAAALKSGVQSHLERAELKPLMADNEKWTKYFLSKRQIGLLRELRAHKAIRVSGDYMDVDVGIVTGQNDFFVVDSAVVDRYGLQDFVIPLAARSVHLRGLRLSTEDWRGLIDEGKRAYLLNVPASATPSHPGLLEYIAQGEQAQLHAGYKCRIRKQWFSVPSVWSPDLFMLRQVAGAPRLVVNAAGATCTDTLHRVRSIGAASPDQIATGFLNSMTFAVSEVTGRSYGGGVMTFEPTEAERLLVPPLETVTLDIGEIDTAFRQNGVNAVLDLVDREMLQGQLGLTEQECRELREIWENLRDRRLGRKTR